MKINSKTASSFTNNLEYCNNLQQLKPGMTVRLFTSEELVRMDIVKIDGKFMRLKVSNDDEEYYNEMTVNNYDRFVNANNEHGLLIKKLDTADEILDVRLVTIDEYDWVWVNHQFIKVQN